MVVGSVDVHVLTNDSAPTSAEVSHSLQVSSDYSLSYLANGFAICTYCYAQIDVSVSASGFCLLCILLRLCKRLHTNLAYVGTSFLFLVLRYYLNQVHCHLCFHCVVVVHLVRYTS